VRSGRPGRSRVGRSGERRPRRVGAVGPDDLIAALEHHQGARRARLGDAEALGALDRLRPNGLMPEAAHGAGDLGDRPAGEARVARSDHERAAHVALARAADEEGGVPGPVQEVAGRATRRSARRRAGPRPKRRAGRVAAGRSWSSRSPRPRCRVWRRRGARRRARRAFGSARAARTARARAPRSRRAACPRRGRAAPGAGRAASPWRSRRTRSRPGRCPLGDVDDPPQSALGSGQEPSHHRSVGVGLGVDPVLHALVGRLASALPRPALVAGERLGELLLVAHPDDERRVEIEAGARAEPSLELLRREPRSSEAGQASEAALGRRSHVGRPEAAGLPGPIPAPNAAARLPSHGSMSRSKLAPRVPERSISFRSLAHGSGESVTLRATERTASRSEPDGRMVASP